MALGRSEYHPGDNPGANLKSISHICHPILVAFVWELTNETIDLPLGCLQGGWGPTEAVARSSWRWGAQKTALEATQGQNDSFYSQLPYKCYLEEVASVGD